MDVEADLVDQAGLEERPGQVTAAHQADTPSVLPLKVTDELGRTERELAIAEKRLAELENAVAELQQGAFDRALPVFRAFGKNIKLCGPAGAGQVVKLINQLLVGVHTAAVAEAAVFGAKLGADPRVVLEVIGTSFGGSTMMTRNVPRFISRDFGPATSITLLLKDLGLIHDEAKAANVPLLLGAVAEQRFLEARARGMGENDMASLVRLWEEAAGVTVDKPRS